MKPQLAPIQYDCTLFHELGHAHYGHVGVTGKQELLANRWAAYRMVSFESLIECAELEQTSANVAASLGVLPSVLQTYLGTLTRAQLGELRQAALRFAA
jgi:antirestriction protein ArdC